MDPAMPRCFDPCWIRFRGVAVGCGIAPRYSDLDTYWMMAACIDEAVRNIVAVGADPDHMAGLDNFCWCDPVQSEKTPDGEYQAWLNWSGPMRRSTTSPPCIESPVFPEKTA